MARPLRSKKRLIWKGLLALVALLMVTNSGWLLLRSEKANLIDSNRKVGHPEVEFKLPKSVTNTILGVYNDVAGRISFTKNRFLIHHPIRRSRKLLFAFVSDNDMVVNGLDLMKGLNCVPSHPANFHRSLATQKEICETILFFFTRGLGSEIYVTNRTQFDTITRVASLVKKKEDLGGNSA